MGLLTILGVSYICGGIGMATTFFERKTPSDIIDDVFKSQNVFIRKNEGKLFAERIKEKNYEWGTRYFYKFPFGLSSEAAKNVANLISEALNKEVQIKHDFYTMIDVFKEKLPKSIPFDIKYINPKNYKVPLGFNQQRELVEFDFNGQFSHLLIGGISGAGKSSIVHSILTTLSLKDVPPDLYLTDLKYGVELSDYEQLDHTKGFATTLEELDYMLDAVIDEMEFRYRTMREQRIKKWRGKPVIIVIDEMIDLKKVSSDDKNMKELKATIREKLMQITSKGRASKIYGLLATQRPDVDVIDGIIKSNVSSTIGFKTRDDIQSRIILDNSLSAELPYIPGRSIFQQSDDVLMQTFYLDEKTQSELLSTVKHNLEEVKVVQHEEADIEDREMEQDIDDTRKVRLFAN